MNKNKFVVLFVLSFIVMLHLIAASSYNAEVTDISPTALVPGETTGLEFRLENNGNADLNNVIFSWEEKTGNILPIGSSNTKSIDSLDQGTSRTLDFDAVTSASATPGLYELTFTIKFDDANGTAITQTSNAGIIIGGQTDFDVSVSDVSSSGVVLSVINTGKNPADSVEVIIPEQSNFQVTGSSSSIIGNLAKGDYSVASFQINSLTRSASNLNVEIQYTDTTGIRQILNKTIELQSTSTGTSASSTASTSSASTTATGYSVGSSSGNSNTLLIIGFAASMILTIGVIIFIVKKNGKKKNENN